MRILIGLSAVVLALSLSPLAQAAYVEYQGTGGSLAVASNWYVISNANNPSSRTGVTRLPLPYQGFFPDGTEGDYAIIRNGTTTTLGTTLTAQHLSIGGPLITGQPTAAASSLYITNGGTLSMFSDDPFEELHLGVGDYYGGTVNQSGGRVYVGANRGGGVTIGQSATQTGVWNMSGGTLYLETPLVNNPVLAVGNRGGKGVINQTGGYIHMGTDSYSADSYYRLGAGGYGEHRISNGGQIYVGKATRIGTEYTPETGPSVAGTGVMTLTAGGTFKYGYRTLVGDGNRGQANVGHIKVLGGTITSDPGMDPIIGGHIWLGRGMGGTATPGAVGKMTVNQAAVINSHGLIMGRDGWDTTNSQLELKINSGADFNVNYAAFLVMAGRLEVSLTDGYAPAVGEEWLIAREGPNPQAGFFSVNFPMITPGFRVETRNGRDVYLINTGLMHSGDSNNDGRVNVGDLGILAGSWGQTTVLGKSWAEGDFNGDDVVNVGDLGILAGNWGWVGTPVASAAVPEPASLVLLGLGGLAMLRRRR